MNVRVIIARPSHASVIAAIGKRSFRDAFEHEFVSTEELNEYLELTYNLGKISDSIKKENNIFFLAFNGNVPAGFAKVKRHSLNEDIESIAQMELQKLYVLPQYHGKGIAAELMQAIFDFANETDPDFLWLNTPITNDKAIRFYEKNGFMKTGKHFFTIGTQTFEYFIMSVPINQLQCN